MLPFFTWLRELSLSGSAGNAAAWALVLLASALPLVPAILLLLRRRRWTDALLLLLPPTIFAALYFGVNPTLAGPVGQFLPVAALGCAASVLLAWVVLGLLRNLAAAPADKLARALGLLLVLCALLLTLTAAVSLFMDWRTAAQAIREGNTAAPAQAEKTVWAQGFLALLRLLPYLLGSGALLLGAGLAVKLGADPFGDDAATLCDRTARLCGMAAAAMVLLELGVNLLQLLLFPLLRSTSFHLQLELSPLAATAALYLLCRYFRQGLALRRDNESII